MLLKEILQNHISINETLYEVKINSELSREDYLRLKHYIELIGGKYITNSKKFVYKTNPKPFIDLYLLTEKMPIKNPTAFFPTPLNIVQDMLKISDFDCLIQDEYFQSKYKVLEPSGGVGGICDLIRKAAPYVQLDVIEILDTNQEILKQKGYSPICMDFMNYNINYSTKYDYIFMNPPYQGKTYIKHLKHAYKMLESNGILTAVIPTSFLTQTDKLSIWLYEKVTQIGEIYINPKGSFIDLGTNVDTCIIYINKEWKNWRHKEYQGCRNYWTWQVWLSLYSSGEVYTYLEQLKNNNDTKENIRNLIINELDKYKKQSIYFSYKYIDDYVEKLFEHYCYIREDSFENNNLEIISNVPTYELYDQLQLEIFQQGTLF